MSRVEIDEDVLGFTNRGFRPASGASVQVNYRDGDPATVYASETGPTELANPLTADDVGRVEGWVAQDSYDLVVTPPVPFRAYTKRWEAITARTVGQRLNPRTTANAIGDGVTDDTAAINATLAAAAAGGGIVYVDAGTYLITGRITVPNGVDMVGDGPWQTVFLAGDTDAEIVYGASAVGGALVNYYGESGGWTFDGNLLAIRGVVFGGGLGTYKALNIRKCNGDGGVLLGQNQKFIGCIWGDNHGSGTVFDNGTGGNRFYGHHSSYNTGYNIESRQTGASTAGAYLVPTDNSFFGGVAEFCGSPSFGESGDGAGCLRQLAGAQLHFHDYTLFNQKTTGQVVKTQPNTASGRSGDVNGRIYFHDASAVWGGGGTCDGIVADAVSGGVAGSFVCDVHMILDRGHVFAGLNRAIVWGTNSPIFADHAALEYFTVSTPGLTPNGTGALKFFRDYRTGTTNLTLSGSWVADPLGIAGTVNWHLHRGYVKVAGSCGGTGTIGTQIGQLPVGSRPNGVKFYTVAAYDGGAWGEALIQINDPGDDNGKIKHITGPTAALLLDDIPAFLQAA